MISKVQKYRAITIKSFVEHKVTIARTLMVVPIIACIRSSYYAAVVGMIIMNDYLVRLNGVVMNQKLKTNNDKASEDYINQLFDKLLFIIIALALYIYNYQKLWFTWSPFFIMIVGDGISVLKSTNTYVKKRNNSCKYTYKTDTTKALVMMEKYKRAFQILSLTGVCLLGSRMNQVTLGLLVTFCKWTGAYVTFMVTRINMQDDKSVRVLVWGCFDLFHHGHSNLFHQAKLFGNHLVVGVVDDTSATLHKRKPVLTTQERVKIVSQSQFVNEVITCDYTITEKFLKKHKIDFCVRGSGSDDKYKEVYKIVNKKGIMRILPYTDGISTKDIVERIFNQYIVGGCD